MQDKKLTFIDLFSGCGGLSEGFIKSGMYDAIAHVEWEIPMVRTLRSRLVKKWNHSPKESFKKVVHFDIQKTNELINGNWKKETISIYGQTNDKNIIDSGLKGIVKGREIDIVIGGPPCQAYSLAGRAQDKNSMNDDYRNYLFESFTKVVVEFQPSVFLFENVPGILSASPGGKKVTERIFEYFNKHGYDIKKPEELHNVVLSASDFGVPQKRERVIIVGVKRGLKTKKISLDDIYKAINRQKITEQKSLREAIGHLPKFKPTKKIIKIKNRKFSHVPLYTDVIIEENHKPRFHNERDIRIFKEWVTKKMNKRSGNERLLFYNSLLNKNSKHSKYRSLDWDKPSQTILAHLQKDGLMFIHPDANQARTITVKEAALIQSFPDDFEFKESMGYNYKMIGNAVPPLMAEKIAIGIAEVFS
ncbi:DNA cytosine methyltransferase [Tenacibaculum finnmarkense]|uniref:DNA cytosine methyltransferase n=1 Tax=Tenacibaculum finnmarkense TaxID=2781243 RepID=UPI001E2981B4|nr:DNA cytosine methyltransferase [Tenacibaculum finnmarkense]MCD8409898.1 DNA cytosine methyltransferase [Tenacibaculum finnmarkense genomovar ulcerans]MCD8445844.1 DNA cytosine methyltransferase [Tenacibaculum finnmarkense genomovar finnmarkense]